MATPYLGQIKIFAGNFAPRGYALCNGQILSIAQNTALFSLLGTFYGGNGQTTFALPDLRGRLPLHMSSSLTLGTSTGAETVTLNTTQLPGHTHTLNGTTSAAMASSPANAALAVPTRRVYTTSGGTQALAATSVGSAGSNQPHSNLQPYLGVNFIIATQGIFPSRN